MVASATIAVILSALLFAPTADCRWSDDDIRVFRRRRIRRPYLFDSVDRLLDFGFKSFSVSAIRAAALWGAHPTRVEANAIPNKTHKRK